MANAAKILIVEDDLFLRELYIETLTSAGYDVDTAVDGEEAYEKIMVGGWDLVLLDIMLPKANGLDLMKKIRSESDMSKSKAVVFLTNLDKEDDIKKALELGNGYLLKSQLTPEDFLNEVKLYLAKN